MADCAGTCGAPLLTIEVVECVPDEWERLCPRWNSELTEDLRASTTPLSLPVHVHTQGKKLVSTTSSDLHV